MKVRTKMKESNLNKLVIIVCITLLAIATLTLVFADEIDNYKFTASVVNKVIVYNIQHQFSYEYGYLNNIDYIHTHKG